MRYVIACAAAATFLALTGSGGAANEPSARGHGETAFQQFSFHARGTPTGADGIVVAHIPLTGFFDLRLLVVGRVTCLKVFGNAAVLTGPVTNVQHFPPEVAELEFDRFYVVVEDNADANPSTPDRWNGTFYKAGTLGDIEQQLRDCNARLPVGNNLLRGDIVVESGA